MIINMCEKIKCKKIIIGSSNFRKKKELYLKKDYDADLTIIDMNKKIEIKNKNIESKCKWSPFHGQTFKGTPVSTIINGKVKMKNGKILGNPEGLPLIF